MYAILILTTIIMITSALLAFKASPVVRTIGTLIILSTVIYATHNISTKQEYARIHNTYFRGISMSFSELDRLARTNDCSELSKKVTTFYNKFSDTTDDETKFNALVEKMLNETRNWSDK